MTITKEGMDEGVAIHKEAIIKLAHATSVARTGIYCESVRYYHKRSPSARPSETGCAVYHTVHIV
jgi:hypothetical protein